MLKNSKKKFNFLKHPPYPPSKEGGAITYFPLGEGGLRGIDEMNPINPINPINAINAK